MAHRHKMHAKAKGGRVVYEGAESHVAHEAEEKKHGGKVVGKVHGHKGKHRIHKARGGSCDTHPFSSAHRG